MSEYYLGTLPVLGFLTMTLGCYMYMRGGRSDKWQRRFVGSFILSSGLWGTFALLGTFSYWYLFVYLLTIATFSKGYGRTNRVLKRFTVVGISLLASLVILGVNSFPSDLWGLFAFEFAIASVTVWLGVKNPMDAAPEEFFVCAFLWLPKLMYPFVLLKAVG
jgi:hypothetical protein